MALSGKCNFKEVMISQELKQQAPQGHKITKKLTSNTEVKCKTNINFKTYLKVGYAFTNKHCFIPD